MFELRLPPTVQTERARPRPPVQCESQDQPPLIDKDAKVEQVWNARIRTFRLDVQDDRDDYQRVWQLVTDGLAAISESRVDFVPATASYVAFLRWSEFEYKLPAK